MADPEHLRILKRGVEAWNNWRKKNSSILSIDLSSLDLQGIDLTKANFRGVNLNGSDLSTAILTGVDFAGADLNRTILCEADLRKSYLGGTSLRHANLTGAHVQEADLDSAVLNEANLKNADFANANLRRASIKKAELRDANFQRSNLSDVDLEFADLSGADFFGSDLSNASLIRANLISTNLNEANLSRSHLWSANFSGASLKKTDFTKASFGNTVLSFTDLSQSVGLDEARHAGPSVVGSDTFRQSRGQIPVYFLKGCGLADWEIESIRLYSPGLTNEEISDVLYSMHDFRASRALQISPLFISYSHQDGEFVDRVEECLRDIGIRYWRDIHHAVSGRIEKQIDVAIRHNPTVILVLSKNSVKSDWVQHEVRLSRKLEIEFERDVLCPIALDDSWKSSPWPQRLMEQVMEYNILDFSKWEDQFVFEKQFRKLLDGLDLFYK